MKHWHCTLFGHEFKVVNRVTDHVKEYQCVHCKTQRTINGDGRLVPLTPKRKAINSTLKDLYVKRLEKKKAYSTSY